MARRRRLEPPTVDDLALIRAAAAADPDGREPYPVLRAPPIAKVAQDSAAAQRREIDALRANAARNHEAAERLAALETDGRMVTDVAIDQIDVDYLTRDRLPRDEEDDAGRALRQSIQTHGQRMPVELANLGTSRARPYGLISGYRRLWVIQRLLSETGEARWKTVRALVRTPATLGQAFVSMVEENELREGLSYFERGRVCMLAAQQGAFASVDAAVDALFAAASPAKRSKIRSFTLLAEEIGDLLLQPEAIGERLGLRVAQAIRAGKGGALRRHLGARAGALRGAAEEQTALARFLSGAATETAPSASPTPALRERILDRGLRIACRTRRGGAVFDVTGGPLTDEALEAALDALVASLSGVRSGRDRG